MRIPWALLVAGVLVAPGAFAHAASWSDVFAADTSRVVFFGDDGSLLRAPFGLAVRETLWRATGRQHVVRVRVSPDGERVAWLTRGDDQDTTRLWVDGAGGPRVRVRYFALEPEKYGRLHSEPGVPTVEDAGYAGIRLVQPSAFMRRLACNTLEWTPDSRAVVFGYNDGIAAVSADGGAGFAVCKALPVHLDLLAPAPIYLVDAIVLRQHMQYFNPVLPGQLATDLSGPYEQEGDLVQEQPVNAMELAHPDVMISKTAWAGSYLLYPLAHRWRVFQAGDLTRSRLWAASPGTVWWAAGSTIRAIRTANPKATDEAQARGPVVWLDYDESHHAAVWAGGREVGRRSEDGGPVSVVLRTGSPIRSGLRSNTHRLVALVTDDSVLIWNPAKDSVRKVTRQGDKPGALVVGPDGQVLLSTDAGRGNPPRLQRADFATGRLMPVETPNVKHGVFRAAGNGRWILLYDPGQKPPDALQVFDVEAGRWTEVANPGISGWEPLAAR